MSRAVRSACFVLVLTLAGCAKDEDYFEVLREQRGAWKEMADILATVHDDKSMTDAKTALEERGKKFDAISRKAKALPNPPPQEVLKRMEADRFVMERTVARLQSEVERVRKLPGGVEFLKQFESGSQGLMSAVKP
jgi:hypothetical protein